MDRSVDFSLYLITDRRQVPSGDLIGAVRQALEGGVRAVQLREKDLCAAELFPLALELRDLTRRYGAQLLLNDRIDVALAVAADGVHLGGHSLPIVEARRLLGPGKLIGVSTHAPAEISDARRSGADFVTFGPVYPTPSKTPFGAPLPLFALGGVTPERLSELRSAGCNRVACIGAVLRAADPGTAAHAFTQGLSPATSRTGEQEAPA